MSAVETIQQGREERTQGRDRDGGPLKRRPTREQLLTQVDDLEREKRSLQQKVRELNEYMKLAYHDVLTGLGNRRFFEKRFGEELNRVSRDPRQALSVLLIDIDDFKRINDTHGHAVGDETLRWVARFLEGSVREQDLVCRFAGDEFVVVLPQTSRPASLLLRQRLQQRLAKVRQWSGVELNLSVGEASFGADGTSMRELFGAADERMYQDKRSRKRALRRSPTAEVPIVGAEACGGFGLGWSEPDAQRRH